MWQLEMYMNKTKTNIKVKGTGYIIVNSSIDIWQMKPPGCTVWGERSLQERNRFTEFSYHSLFLV